MHLYNLTLERSGQIISSVSGNFSSSKAQEIVVNKGKVLALLRPDENGKLLRVSEVEIFGQIRSLLPFRLTGQSKDYLIVSSDSGRIIILEFKDNKWVKLHQETFGKSGCRRLVPGQYLGVDPKGRALMLGALEKQKFVYVLNRDTNAKLTISSPLSAHRANTAVYSLTGLDVGFENPVFASLEMCYDDNAKEEATEKLDRSAHGQDYAPYLPKNVVMYELDLGLNHVVRKNSIPVDSSAHMIFSCPSAPDGPGGFFVCSENYITWHNHVTGASARVSIPRRLGLSPETSMIIVSSVCIKSSGTSLFFLVQTEMGDLLKMTLNWSNDVVKSLELFYFDTIPASISLTFLKSGYLFSAAEFGNNNMYQFAKLGDKDPLLKGKQDNDPWLYFQPHPLQNLVSVDQLSSFAPFTDLKVVDLLKEETPQLYALSGKGRQSTLRVLRHGLSVNELAVSPLGGVPSAVWTLKASLKDEFDKYIVVSFANATFVLLIGETVEEAKDSGLVTTVPTLHVGNIGKEGIVQVYANGWKHILPGNRVNEWKPAGKKTVVHACSNSHQLVVALSGGEMIYFEVDSVGQMIEIAKETVSREIACMAISPVAPGSTKAKYLAIGDWDKVIRVYALDGQPFERLGVQSVNASPESLLISRMTTDPKDPLSTTLFLCIGLNNGVMLRCRLESEGEMTDPRTRLLGTKPVKFAHLTTKESASVIAISSRSWLLHPFQGKFLMTPLSQCNLDSACRFASEDIPEGIVGISGHNLRILVVDKLGETFNQIEIPLLHTPRQFVIHPWRNQIITIETDHNAVDMTTMNTLKWEPEKSSKGEKDPQDEDEEDEEEDEQIFGEPRSGRGRWASAIRVLDPISNNTLELLELSANEAAFSITTCVFKEKENEVFVVVGTVQDLVLAPRSLQSGFIHVYRLIEGKKLQLYHKTAVEDIPKALCPFQGRLLVGVGNTLRIYDLGKKKLLRKCENKNFPHFITEIHTMGNRIYVADAHNSVHFVNYKKAENQLSIFADETVPRSLTSIAPLDYNTIAGGDKFGNIFVSRLNAQVSEEMDDDPMGVKLTQGYLNGAPHRLEQLINFHVGETITSLQKASFSTGSPEAIIYSTVSGAIGAALPFSSREDLDFFSHLEMYMRQEHLPLCGRDHIAYRSAYFPVKDVIDGDLCEQFLDLDYNTQKAIAENLDNRTPLDIIKKLEDIRNKL